ncbi:RDD family protein [Antrihabitans sp. YC2-6]|uniref:RDD family protein n=1 Tax=Antrihabitans sp. YC2-6 TaxID=2799498 RepID=UPI0018F2BA7D|nr:RDD family protein [Antrihabitans sp. YC2-6]MBJ8344892.1 RDD family protein [Antrihabitans sp. YC2-6]
MARITGEWLNGPSAALPHDGPNATPKYRGERLGLPENGPGSLALSGRRVAALTIDWLMALGISALIVGSGGLGTSISTITLLVWAVIGVVGVTLFSYTPGQLVVGIQVGRIDNVPRVGVVRAIVRTLLLALVVPAVITDVEGRGFHDRLSKTVVVLAR